MSLTLNKLYKKKCILHGHLVVLHYKRISTNRVQLLVITERGRYATIAFRKAVFSEALFIVKRVFNEYYEDDL